MGACSSEDQATYTDNPSNRRLSHSSVVRPSDSRRVSEASVACTRSNRRFSQSGLGDIQSTSAIRPFRSSPSFLQPVVCRKWENEDQLKAPDYGSEPLVDFMVAYQDINVYNPQEIIVAGDDTQNVSDIMTAPTDVPLSHPTAQIQPAFEPNIKSLSNVVQMEPVVVNSSVPPYSGYQGDDNGVLMNSSGETVDHELHGNQVYDPLIDKMVHVLDQNAPVDGLEGITATEINASTFVLSNDMAA